MDRKRPLLQSELRSPTDAVATYTTGIAAYQESRLQRSQSSEMNDKEARGSEVSESVTETVKFVLVDEDNLFCEYEPRVRVYDCYRSLDEEEKGDTWKSGRPTYLKSLALCVTCAFTTTILSGIPVGFLTSVCAWLDLNLAEACYSRNWNEIPLNVRRIRLTAQVAEGMFIQFWSFSALLFMFGWKRLSDLNIPIWNVLGAAVDAIYRLFLNTYGVYYQRPHDHWMSYPLNVLFVAITAFNFYRITKAFEQGFRLRMKLAVKLGMAFILGTPMFLLMNYFLYPAYANYSDDKMKAVFSTLLPAVFIIPKAVINICLVDIAEYCGTGKSAMLVVGFHTNTAIVARYLQANIESIEIFTAICFMHGFESLLDKATFNLRMKGYRFFCGSCVGNGDPAIARKRQHDMNRIIAEQSISGMILETDTIFMSCALVSILLYFFGEGNHKWNTLAYEFTKRVTIAGVIEMVFNVIAIQIQTYYFNIPVIRVWKKKWWWILLTMVTYSLYATLYNSEYLYRPVLSQSIYDQNKLRNCSMPFHRPYGITPVNSTKYG